MSYLYNRLLRRSALLLSIALVVAIPGTWGQDQHFTQFYAAPLSFNPALTGAFNGNYRFGIIYRDQWRKALDYPNVTYAASADLRFPMRIRGRDTGDAFGGGIIFFSDNYGALGFSTNQVQFSTAFHKALSQRSNQYLSLGLQGGFAQRNINLENLTFDDQFDGSTGFINPTGEQLPENNFTYGDLSVGLNYSFEPNRGTAVFAGLAFHHLFRPEMSFYANDDSGRDFEDLENSPLYMKFTSHLALLVPLSNTVQLLPRALLYLQGPHLALNAGANIRFPLGAFDNTALQVGGWLRPARDINTSMQLESAILMAGFEFRGILLGLSYDANLRDISGSGNRRNALEISLSYFGNSEGDGILCPKF